MDSARVMFRFYRQDIFASISLFLISLPITVGIAIASHMPPEAGMISAIFGALFFGFFSSSQLMIVGPAAGLCVFLAAFAPPLASGHHIATATMFAGLILFALANVNAYKVIHLFPMSVLKGMAAGIGFTLVFKMIPHLVGFDHTLLESVDFVDIDATSGTTWSDLINSWNALSPGVLIISLVSLGLILIDYLWRKKRAAKDLKESQIPHAFIVVLIGVGISWIFTKYFPHLALHENQMVHIASGAFQFNTPTFEIQDLWPSLRLAIIITTVILLEGFININLIEKHDPKRAVIHQKKRTSIIGNCKFCIRLYWCASRNAFIDS